MLFMRGAGPVGYPGAAEVVNMRPPAYLIKKGVHALPCIGDGRQSGTSGSPSILNASPEAAAGGGLALLRTGDRVRIDLNTRHGRRADRQRRSSTERRAALEADGGYQYPALADAVAGNPARAYVGQLDERRDPRRRRIFQRIAQTRGLPRDNH